MNIASIPNLSLKRISLLTASLAALALAGCGSESTANKAAAESPTASAATQAVDAATQPDSQAQVGSASADRKPCEYMARADAEAAVGQPLPKTTENIPLGMCDYNTAEFYGASLTVSSWEAIKNAATSGSPQHQPTPISGVGDEALNLGGLLYVRKGDQGFLLTLNGPNIDHLPDQGLELEKTLALKILPNL